MEIHSVLLLFIFLTQHHTVSSVVLNVLQGSPVTLHISHHEERKDIREIKWQYNTTQTVLQCLPNHNVVDVTNRYKGRVEFDKADFSLTLKNLQKNDSGLYTAFMDFTNKPAETRATYEIAVFEPVVAPTLTVLSNWSSSGSCNVTLKCTGLNVSLISSCNGTFCSQEGGSRFISISINKNTVSCNHSNPVSWNTTILDLSQLCPSNNGNNDIPGSKDALSVKIGVPLALVALVTAVGAAYVWRRRRAEADTHDQGQSEQGDRQDDTRQPMTAESTEMTENTYAEAVSQVKGNTETPTTVYDTVQLTRTPDSSSTEHAHQILSTPETIYAVVKKKDNA